MIRQCNTYCYGFGSYYGQVVDNWNTEDFHAKNNSCEKLLKFLRFCSILKIFLAVDDWNMDKLLENSWSLVYYQVSGEPGITGCSFWSDIYLRECGLGYKLIYRSSLCNFIFHVLNFRSWSWPQNNFNSKIFLIYGSRKWAWKWEIVQKFVVVNNYFLDHIDNMRVYYLCLHSITYYLPYYASIRSYGRKYMYYYAWYYASTCSYARKC